MKDTSRLDAILRAADWYAQQAQGTRLSWLEIEQGTGLSVANPRSRVGRDMFRAAARRTGRPYLPLPGYGVEVASKDNAEVIVSRKANEIQSRVELARVTVREIFGMNIPNTMSEERKQRMLLSSSFISTMDLVARDRDRRGE